MGNEQILFRQRFLKVAKGHHQIVCRTCGFTTNNPTDMILHLAKKQLYKEENCSTKLIDLEVLIKDDKKRTKS